MRETRDERKGDQSDMKMVENWGVFPKLITGLPTSGTKVVYASQEYSPAFRVERRSYLRNTHNISRSHGVHYTVQYVVPDSFENVIRSCKALPHTTSTLTQQSLQEYSSFHQSKQPWYTFSGRPKSGADITGLKF